MGLPVFAIQSFGELSVEKKLEVLRAQVSEIVHSISDEYDPTKTYTAGQLVTHEGKLYRAKVDISTPEAWNPEHWEERDIEDEITRLTNEIASKYSASNPPPYPVASVNGKTGAVNLGAADVGAATEAWVEAKGYLTQHQSLSAYRTALAQDAIDSGKEASENKVTGISASSTDTQYPSAKAVYTFIQSLDGNGVAY